MAMALSAPSPSRSAQPKAEPMTDLSPRAAAPGARSPFVSPTRRRWPGLVPGLLATLLLSGVGTVVTARTAEAAPRARAHATVARHVEARPPQRRASEGRHGVPQRAASSAVTVAPPASVLSALQRAEAATGADPALLLAIARRESGFDPAARNHRSSARGLMQFTDATWLEVVRDFGHRHGLAQQAVALSAAPRGGVPPNAHLVAEVLRLRDDPRLAAVMTAERLEAWRGPLEQALGRAVTPTDLYFVHLLGPAGARRFLLELARAPGQAAAGVVGGAAEANRSLFVRDGRALSLAEVHRDVARSLAIGPRETAAAAMGPIVQVAEAR